MEEKKKERGRRHSTDRRGIVRGLLLLRGGSRFRDIIALHFYQPSRRIPSPPSGVRSIGLNSRGGYTEIGRGFAEHSVDREITRRDVPSWGSVSKMPRGFTRGGGAGIAGERWTGTAVSSS